MYTAVFLFAAAMCSMANGGLIGAPLATSAISLGSPIGLSSLAAPIGLSPLAAPIGLSSLGSPIGLSSLALGTKSIIAPAPLALGSPLIGRSILAPAISPLALAPSPLLKAW